MPRACSQLVRRAFRDFATGRFTKDEIRKAVIVLGLKRRRGQPVPSQTFDGMLRNRVYIAQVDVPDYGVSTRGDFEPLVSVKDVGVRSHTHPRRKRLYVARTAR